jgi:hypothetical protein
MPVFTTTALATEVKSKKGAHQGDTIGEVYTKTIRFTIPANTAANDTAVVGKLPAGTVVLNAWGYANANVGTANVVATLATTTAAALVTFAANTMTTAVAVRTAAANAVITANATAFAGTVGDEDLTVTVTGATQANAITLTTTLLCFNATPDVAPYSTFSV